MTSVINRQSSPWPLLLRCPCKADLGPVLMTGSVGGCCRVQCHITVMHLSSKGIGFYSSGSSLLMDSCLSLMYLIRDLCIHVSFREAFKGWVWGRFFLFVCFEWAEVSDFHQLLGAWLGSALPEWSSSALSQSESSYRPWFHGKTWITHISWLGQTFYCLLLMRSFLL